MGGAWCAYLLGFEVIFRDCLLLAIAKCAVLFFFGLWLGGFWMRVGGIGFDAAELLLKVLGDELLGLRREGGRGFD